MENKLFQFNSMMKDYEIVNPEFAKVKVYVCYAGKNRNRTEIPQDVLEDMSKTIYGIPVIGEYDSVNNCLKGHGGKLEITDDGVEFVQTTVPYGFVDPTTPVFYETVTELDGITKNDYLCCYAYLWYKRYPEIESVLKNQDNKPIGQSMEVEVEDYSMSEDDYFVFKKAHFSALCLLGVEPCFESAKATSKFSIEDSKATYQEMMEAFKSYTLKNFEEGGNEVEDFKKKRKCSKCETEHEVSDDFSDDEEFICDLCKEENTFSKKTTVFELSFDDIREKLYQLIKKEDCYCWIVETFTDKFIYVKEIWEDDKYECRYYKQGYEMDNEDIKLVGDSIEVFAEFLTQEEIDKLNEEKQSYTNNIETLKAENYDLQTKFGELDTEVKFLREYKAEIEQAKFEAEETNRRKFIDSELEEFSELNSCDGYKEIMDKKYEVDVETSKILLKALAYDNGVILGKKKNFSKKDKTVVTIPIENINTDIEKDPYDGILDKYINKK